MVVVVVVVEGGGRAGGEILGHQGITIILFHYPEGDPTISLSYSPAASSSMSQLVYVSTLNKTSSQTIRDK